MIVAPSKTLALVAVLSVLAGVLWGLLAGIGIYAGSVFVRPRLPRGRVWAEWRRKRFLWGGCLALGGTLAVLSADAIFRNVGLRDLYWLGRPETLGRIAWLGGLVGYLLALFVLVAAATIHRLAVERKRR